MVLTHIDEDIPNLSSRGFRWSEELTISAQSFLTDMKGCAVDPLRIVNDGNEDDYLSEIATFDDHKRFFITSERHEWETPEDFVIDLILADHYISWQLVDAIFDNEFDQIGLACDCHPTFKKICILEVGKNVERAHQFYPDLSVKP